MDFLIIILPVESLSLIKTREYISIAARKKRLRNEQYQ